jgi:hypothetical protein
MPGPKIDGRGTFALQGHPPMPGHVSKACFQNIRVKVLPD